MKLRMRSLDREPRPPPLSGSAQGLCRGCPGDTGAAAKEARPLSAPDAQPSSPGCWPGSGWGWALGVSSGLPPPHPRPAASGEQVLATVPGTQVHVSL